MGIPKLWNELQVYGHDVALARLADAVAERSGKTRADPTGIVRLGIDIAGWLFHAQKAQGGRAPQLRSLFYRMCRLLSLHTIHPVFVFDGPGRPSMKRGRHIYTTERGGQDDNGGWRLLEDTKELIEAFGFTYIDAPGEAEAELASLNQRGLLDAVMTDDVDAFVFGAKVVVRFWGVELTSVKARSDFLLGRGEVASEVTLPSSQATSGASTDSDSSSSSQQDAGKDQRDLSESQKKALQENSVTYYDSREMQEDVGLDQGALVLVAILSGGDYDVKGLARCGIKIALALARAGFGKELCVGVQKHLKPLGARQCTTGQSRSRPPSPEPSSGWDEFIDDWRHRLCSELRSNATGHLGRKFKKLSESQEVKELLSTPAALAVLATYVWPLVSGRSVPIKPKPIDLLKIASLVQDRLGWRTDWTMEAMRSKVWSGTAMRMLAKQCVADVSVNDLAQAQSDVREAKAPVAPAKAKTAKSKSTDVKISSFFASSRKMSAQDEIREPDQAESLRPQIFQSEDILGERMHASTDFLPELRISIPVSLFARVARKGLRTDIVEDKQSDAGSSPRKPNSLVHEFDLATSPSPRKSRHLHFTDANLPIRIWIPRDIILDQPNGKHVYDAFVKRRLDKQQKKNKVISPKKPKQQNGLQSFFIADRGTRTMRQPPSILAQPKAQVTKNHSSDEVENIEQSHNTSPSKRRASGRAVRREGRHLNDSLLPSASPSSSPPDSPTLSRRHGKRMVNTNSSLASRSEDADDIERRLLQQSIPYTGARLNGHVGPDDSIEIVKVRTLAGKSEVYGDNDAVVLGSVTISDDSDGD